MPNHPAIQALAPTYPGAPVLTLVMALLAAAGALLLLNVWMPANRSIPAVASAVMLLCQSLIFFHLRQCHRT